MTNYKLSQLHPLGESPALSDLVPIVRVSDTVTPPADAAGSDQTVTVQELLTALGLTGGTLADYLAPAVVNLTFGSSIPVDASAGNAFNVTLTSSSGVMANPSNLVDGEVLRFRIRQDGTGSRTVGWGTVYDFGAVGAPTLSPGAGKLDIVAFEYAGTISKLCFLGAGLGY